MKNQDNDLLVKKGSADDISFGCMSLDVKKGYSVKLLQSAFDNGINYYDTADLYNQGKNEVLVGKALKPFREKAIIATKVGNELNNEGTSWRWNPSKDYILKAVDESLIRLQTDYIDLYQLHGGTIDDPIDETIEAFEILKAHGKIKAYGISSIRPNVINEWAKRSNISNVMMQYSLLDRRPEETCLALLESKQIDVLARGVLAKGLLIDKPPKQYIDHSEAAIDQYQRLLKEINKNSSLSISLQFVLKNPAIASAVVGIRTEEQLKSVLMALEEPDLSESDFGMLQKIFPRKNYDAHRIS
ncbi:MAG: aldo/keto reductase [Cyclobacteriaceae bacterium]